MFLTFNYPHPDGITRQYNYDEEKFRLANNVPKNYIAAGFIITSADQKKFYIGVVDGGHGFIEDFSSDAVQVGSNPSLLMDIAKSIDGNVSINALFSNPNTKEPDVWFPLPFKIDSDNSFHREHLTERDEPLKSIDNKKTFPWEKTLVQDFNFLGKRYPIIKKYITEDLGETWDFETLNAITRFYKGPALDYVIYDLIQLAPTAESLDDIISYKLGSPNIRTHLLKAYENLKAGIPTPVHPYAEFIPLLKEGLYPITLLIHEMSNVLSQMIATSMKFTPKTPYTAQMDGPLSAIISGFNELRNTRIETEHAFKGLILLFKKDFDPRVFYHVQPQVSISKLKECVSLTETILINLEAEMIEALDINSDITKQRQALRKRLNETEKEFNAIQATRDRLEKSISSNQQLSTSKMNLTNLKLKVKKTQKALKEGKISQESHDIRTKEYLLKINKLDILIKEVETLSIETIKQRKNEAVSKSKELTILLKSLKEQIDCLPKTFKVTESLRANCSFF